MIYLNQRLSNSCGQFFAIEDTCKLPLFAPLALLRNAFQRTAVAIIAQVIGTLTTKVMQLNPLSRLHPETSDQIYYHPHPEFESTNSPDSTIVRIVFETLASRCSLLTSYRTIFQHC